MTVVNIVFKNGELYTQKVFYKFQEAENKLELKYMDKYTC